jgi:transposase
MSHRTAPRFVAEIGTLARFSSPDALASYAGLTPTVWQSGGSSGSHYLSRRCNLRLRQALWSSAIGSLKTPASRRFYLRKREEGKSHCETEISVPRWAGSPDWSRQRRG